MCLKEMYNNITKRLESNLLSLGLFLLRLSLALPFWKSGLTKWDYIKNDNLDTLYFLFEDYNVPFLSVEFAAWSGTLAELICPILLVFGFSTRFAALGILVLSGTIYIVDQNPDTFLWSSMAFMIFILGAGKISFDNLLKSICSKC